jgi:isoleucyl-tRNA synthetase
LAFKEVENFLINDFSKVYLKLIKDRTDERDENLVVIMNEVLKKVLVMLGSAIPFKAEKLYLESSLLKKKDSIFLENLSDVDSVLIKKIEEKEIDKNFDLAQDVIAAILNSREKAKIGVRWPLSQVDIISTIDLKSKLEVFEPLIKKLTNIMKIKYDLEDVEVNFIVKPNFVTIKKDFENVSEIIKVINLNKHYISKDLKNELSSGTYDGINLDYNKHIIKEIELSNDYVSSDFGNGNLILHTVQDEILLEEGFIREITRRIQSARKEMGLDKKDEVNLSFDSSDEYIKDLVSNYESSLKNKVGAVDILENKLENVFELDIKDKKLVVSIERV